MLFKIFLNMLRDGAAFMRDGSLNKCKIKKKIDIRLLDYIKNMGKYDLRMGMKCNVCPAKTMEETPTFYPILNQFFSSHL